jgi:HK97 family phage prohead protease
MEFKHFALEWKTDDQGMIEGYGSVFDVADNGNDIVAQGAFTRSLQSGRKVKMLLQHDASDVIGVWDELSEDGNGLRVKGRVLTSISKAREALELVKAGALDGLSIGYRTVKSMDRNGKRVILQADLWEVSLVTFPMNEMARIDAVKAAEMSRDEIERMLTLRAGLSRSVARKLLSDGYDGIKDMRGAVTGADELAQLLMARAAL